MKSSGATFGSAARDGILSFVGEAVGDGHRVGLPVLDDEIAAGTLFSVYVSASVAVR